MSMSTSIVYGYGINLENGIDKHFLIEFLTAPDHKDTILRRCNKKEIDVLQAALKIQNTCNNPDLAELMETYEETFFEALEAVQDSITGIEGTYAIVANIMAEETDIRFEYQGGDDNCGSHPAILFSAAYPWRFNKIERELTEEKLDQIYTTYAIELGISLEEIDYLSIEYYG